MKRSVRKFLDHLSSTEVGPLAFNQYGSDAPRHRANTIRRKNLSLYLEEMEIRRPRHLLIGEAPSHRGGRMTGVPFLSERILLDGVVEARMFGPRSGYQKTSEREQATTEASATMVWEAIRRLEPLPLLWNAFPFHPFLLGNPLSNRAPTAAELRLGFPFIQMLLERFAVDSIVAIGNKASFSLTALGVAHQKIRHPSQGGKRDFVRGLNKAQSITWAHHPEE